MSDIEQQARELLADCLDEWGHPYEAANVRAGDDLDSYENELRLICTLLRFGLNTPRGHELAALASQPQAPAAAVPDEVRAIGHLIATQDNWITDAPIFIVQQKRMHAAHPDYDHDRIAWVDADGEASAEEAQALEAQYASSGQEPDGWTRAAIGHTWEFVTACFTEQGCKDHIAHNGHNLREPRIYAAGSFRNKEWRAVRSFLLAAAPAPEVSDG